MDDGDSYVPEAPAITMSGFFLMMFFDLVSGVSRRCFETAEAFGAAPTNRVARRYRIIALSCFLAMSMLMLTGALFDTLAGNRAACEAFGWTGAAFIPICFFCGLRYTAVNGVATVGEADSARSLSNRGM